MAAPSASELKTAIIGHLPSDFKPSGNEVPKGEGGITQALDDWLLQVCTGIASAWSTWQSTAKFGGATVSGAGIGAWTGSGSGGVFSTTPTLSLSAKYGTTDETILMNALKTKFQAAFNQWVSSFTLSGCIFTGTSTATPVNPGTFTANNAPQTLAIGTTTLMSSLGADMKSACGFDYANSKSGAFMDALGSALSSKFNTWRSASTMTSNSVTGAAVAGTGNGTGASLVNGVIS